MKDGEVVEDNEDDAETVEDDEETGTKTCCGCFSCATGEDAGSVLIAYTVSNETITITSLDNIGTVSTDQHSPLPTVEDHIAVAAEDIIVNLDNTVATALVNFEGEEKYSDTQGENTDTKAIRQSEKIVNHLMDDLISEITRT